MARRGQGEGSVYQRGDGYWCANVRLPNGRRVVRYARTKKEASTLLAQLSHRRRTGVLAAPTKIQVGEWLDQWLEHRYPELRPTTFRKYESVVRVHLAPGLGPLRLSRLTSAHVAQLVGELARDRAYTAQVARDVLNMACEYAVRLGVLGANPVEAVDSPTARPRKRHRWDLDEAVKFLGSIGGDRDEALWVLLAGSGMRIGEALGLQWGDIDFDGGLVHIRRALAWVGSRPVLGEPKTKAGERSLALPSFVLTQLRHWKAHQAEDHLRAGADWIDGRDAVFTRTDGGPPWSSVLGRRFRKACDGAGVPQMRVHDLRHVHASLAVASGADPKTIQTRLGHATLEMTLNVYSHRVQDSDRRLAESFDVLLGGDRKLG